MLSAFETMAQKNPMRVCFASIDADGSDVPYGYQQTRLLSAAIAWRMQEFGAKRNTYVMVDLPNLPIYPLLVLAAAYGGFGLVLMDYTAPPAKKEEQKAAFSRELGEDLVFCIDKTNVLPLMRWAIDFLAGKHEVRAQEEGSLGANLTQRTVNGRGQTGRSGGFLFSGGNGQRNSGSFGSGGFGGNNSNSAANRANQSKAAQDTCVHFAERQSHLFKLDAPAFIFGVEDSAGRSRAVCHTWRSMLGSAKASMRALDCGPMTVWQCVLPLWTMEGLQVVLRALVGSNSFVLYRRFDTGQVLHDVARYRVTHIALTPAQLDALLQEQEQVALRVAAGASMSMPADAFSQYACVLVECDTRKHRGDIRTFKAARRASNHVRLSYGTVETAGMLAVEDDLVRDDGEAGLV